MINQAPYTPLAKTETASEEALQAINDITISINELDSSDLPTDVLLFLTRRAVTVMAICRDYHGWEDAVAEWKFAYKFRDKIQEIQYPQGDNNGKLIFGDMDAQ